MAHKLNAGVAPLQHQIAFGSKVYRRDTTSTTTATTATTITAGNRSSGNPKSVTLVRVNNPPVSPYRRLMANDGADKRPANDMKTLPRYRPVSCDFRGITPKVQQQTPAKEIRIELTAKNRIPLRKKLSTTNDMTATTNSMNQQKQQKLPPKLPRKPQKLPPIQPRELPIMSFRKRDNQVELVPTTLKIGLTKRTTTTTMQTPRIGGRKDNIEPAASGNKTTSSFRQQFLKKSLTPTLRSTLYPNSESILNNFEEIENEEMTTTATTTITGDLSNNEEIPENDDLPTSMNDTIKVITSKPKSAPARKEGGGGTGGVGGISARIDALRLGLRRQKQQPSSAPATNKDKDKEKEKEKDKKEKKQKKKVGKEKEKEMLEEKEMEEEPDDDGISNNRLAELGIQTNELEIADHSLVVGDTRYVSPSASVIAEIEKARKEDKIKNLLNIPRRSSTTNQQQEEHIDRLNEFLQRSYISKKKQPRKINNMPESDKK